MLWLLVGLGLVLAATGGAIVRSASKNGHTVTYKRFPDGREQVFIDGKRLLDVTSAPADVQATLEALRRKRG